jgi:hypothetical protein
MGRWAQRRLSGGAGGQSIGVLAHIIAAAINDPVTAETIYNTSISDVGFGGGEFTSQPSGEVSTAVIESTPTSFLIAFPADISGDSSIEYNGSVPGFLSPDSKGYT